MKRSPGLPFSVVVVFLIVVGAVVAFQAWQDQQLPESVQQLVDFNPGWVIVDAKRGQLTVTEIASGASLMISASEAGPYVLKRVPCSELSEATPDWFRLPPPDTDPGLIGCVKLSAPGHEVYVTNFRTTLGVPEIWTEFYEPLLGDYPVGYWGGSSTVGEPPPRHPAASGAASGSSAEAPASDDGDRHRNTLSYNVEPRTANPTRRTHLDAFYVDRKPMVVVAFRNVAP